jgi:hypothetical protein
MARGVNPLAIWRSVPVARFSQNVTAWVGFLPSGSTQSQTQNHLRVRPGCSGSEGAPVGRAVNPRANSAASEASIGVADTDLAALDRGFRMPCYESLQHLGTCRTLIRYIAIEASGMGEKVTHLIRQSVLLGS